MHIARCLHAVLHSETHCTGEGTRSPQLAAPTSCALPLPHCALPKYYPPCWAHPPPFTACHTPSLFSSPPALSYITSSQHAWPLACAGPQTGRWIPLPPSSFPRLQRGSSRHQTVPPPRLEAAPRTQSRRPPGHQRQVPAAEHQKLAPVAVAAARAQSQRMGPVAAAAGVRQSPGPQTVHPAAARTARR